MQCIQPYRFPIFEKFLSIKIFLCVFRAISGKLNESATDQTSIFRLCIRTKKASTYVNINFFQLRTSSSKNFVNHKLMTKNFLSGKCFWEYNAILDKKIAVLKLNTSMTRSYCCELWTMETKSEAKLVKARDYWRSSQTSQKLFLFI